MPIDDLKSAFLTKNNSLDIYFLWNKLKILCAYYNMQSVFKFSDYLHWQKDIEHYMTHKKNVYNIAIEIYWKIIIIRKDLNNLLTFNEILNDINTCEFEKLDYDEQKEITQYVISLCIILIVRKNQTQLNLVLFDLYKLALTKSYLTNHNNKITQRTFKNIIRSAINNNKMNWAFETIMNSKKYINIIDQKDAYNYNIGVYYYYKNDFSKALKYFSKLPYDNLYYALDLRTFLVRIYFETEETDLLISLIDSFRAYLKRNKTFSKVLITSFRNFLNTVKRLNNISIRDKKKLKLLKIKIENQNPVIEKKWLLNTLEKRIL